jgi:hypothetical protein
MARYLRGLVFGIVLIGILASVAACNAGFGGIVNGSGQVRTESRTVRDFKSVDLTGVGTLVITQGSTEALTIEAEDNLLPVLTSEVRNGRLTLGARDHTIIRPTKPIRYTLAVKNLEAIDISGSGDVQAATLKSDRFKVEISGSGNATIDRLTATTLTANISGSGNITLAGTVNRQEISISGSGKLQADNLASKEARINTSGNGRGTLRVSDTLDVRISGSGSVGYIGSPRVSTDISGSGRVSQVGAQ